MKIFGIGIDIIEIKRIKNMNIFFRNKLAKKILSKNEFKKYLLLKNCIKFLIKRFSVKEACVKALGTGIIKNLSFKNFEIYNNKLGKPKIKFLKKNLNFYKKKNIKKSHISISHEKKYFCAIVILES
ncbi:holo-ACP synthase [Buchnera aphidicola (Ceratoglyphina bambusae)]|uniref:holo-ACP synthase n=1 Tax=Buchnera aphidicola TaxID=9 RepID=UPI0031B85204